MSIKMATWLNGNGAHPEQYPYSQRRMAGSGLFGGADRTQNWFHFPFTTPVIVEDKRLKLTRVFVHYRLRHCNLRDVHVFDGRFRVADFQADIAPQVRAINGQLLPPAEHAPNDFVEGTTMFTLASPTEIKQGLSVSVHVHFNSEIIDGSGIPNLRHLGSVEFYSAGADWA